MTRELTECGGLRVKAITVTAYLPDGTVDVDHGWTSVAIGERLVPNPNAKEGEPSHSLAGELVLTGPVTAERSLLSALFYEPTGATWNFRFGIDWHQGGVAYLDGVTLVNYRPPAIGGPAGEPLTEQACFVFSSITIK